MFQPAFTPEINQGYGFQVVNLIAAMRPVWNASHTFSWRPFLATLPGDPSYDHDSFRQYYTYHHPVTVQLKSLPKPERFSLKK